MNQKASQKPPSRSDKTSSLNLGGAETVTINVGPNSQPFKIHRPLICNASAFFTTAFTSKFKEGLDLSLSLPDDDSEIFEIFAQWLYTKQYHYKFIKDNASSRAMAQPVNLYIFADRYEIPVLKQRLIGMFFAAAKASEEEPPPAMIEHVYVNTSKSDKLRMLLVDWWWMIRYFELPLPTENGWLDDTAEFAVDLLRGLNRKKLGDDLFSEGTAETYF